MAVWKIVILIIVAYNIATVGVGFLLFRVSKVRNFLFGIWLTPYFGVLKLVNRIQIAKARKRFILVYRMENGELSELYRVDRKRFAELQQKGQAEDFQIAENKDPKCYLSMYSKELPL